MTRTMSRRDTATDTTTIPIPDSLLACADCGQATPRPTTTSSTSAKVFQVNAFRTESAPVALPVPAAISLTRCPECHGRAERAAALCLRHPQVGRRLGSAAVHRVTHLLSALAAITVGVTDHQLDTDVGAMLRIMSPTAGLVTWSSRCGPTILAGAGAGRAATAPWAAVDAVVIEQVRQGWGRVLAERVAANRPPVSLPAPPPLGACGMCGLAALVIPAALATRDDGPRWSMITVPVGPDRQTVPLCPACFTAYSAVGSWGPTATERALISFLDATGRGDEARSLRNRLTEVAPPRIRPFAALWAFATRRGILVPVGSIRPWQHVRLG